MRLALISHCLFLIALVRCQDIECTQEGFFTFKIEFEKTYETEDEQLMRKAIFINNCLAIQRHNAQDDNYLMKINQFSDLTEDEKNNISKMEPPTIIPYRISSSLQDNIRASAPDTFSWADYCAITPVKNQGACGACWVFQSVGISESFIKIKTGVQTDLSEEYVLECSSGNCNGGAPHLALQQIVSRQGIPTEYAYPYTVAEGHPTKPSTAGICAAEVFRLPPNTSYKTYTQVSHEQMKQMLSQSPVAAYFWATTKFYSYSAGLFSCPYDPTMSQMNHGVMIFGYDANGNYYLKNSWGVRWGYQGYAIINKDYDCGIRKIVIQLSDGTSTNRLAYNPACSSIISQLKAFTSNYASTLWISVWLVLLMIIFI